MGGLKRIGALLGCLFFAVPAWANDWATFKFPEPSARLELISFPLVPAPLEQPTQPLWFHIQVMSSWSYPTEAEFVTSPLRPSHHLWIIVALEKYQTRFLSPADFPYMMVAQAPLSIH